MGLLIYENKLINTRTGESVLEALLREGIEVSFNCKAGICHSCMMQKIEGYLPASSQVDLNQEYIEKGYFLACQCRGFKRLRVKNMT